jgi:methyltransferase-like protein/2-polyprenyl-3-methyl-5-hydroxy-6-metoxy-1,4-benzoquinol methylase
MNTTTPPNIAPLAAAPIPVVLPFGAPQPPAAVSTAAVADTTIAAAAKRTEAIAAAYDSVPYQSKPLPQTTPEQIGGIARLFGLQPPDFRKARVLELGCSSGGNLIPLALNYPETQIVGVDISSVQVEQGLEMIKSLGLSNIELKVLDITKIRSQYQGTFDYIICHGVFSWVPVPVRDAILDTVRDMLSPNGVAYISYNVYPGWKQREIVRDLMMMHANQQPTPEQRLAQAKSIVAFARDHSPEESAYGKMLREHIDHLSKSNDYYLYHEYLEMDNSPMYFKDFIALAATRKLSYLGEAVLSDMTTQRLSPEVQKALRQLSGGDILLTEQYMDFFTNRTFRQTLLVHEAQMPHVNRRIGLESLSGLRFRTTLILNEKANQAEAQKAVVARKAKQQGKGNKKAAPEAAAEPSAVHYIDPNGRTISTGTTIGKLFLHVLMQRSPGTITFEELIEQMKLGLQKDSSQPPMDPAVLTQSVIDQLGQLLVLNVVHLYQESYAAQPLPASPQDKPKAYTLAHQQSLRGQDWLTNRMHYTVTKMSPGQVAVIRLLDGTRTVADLHNEIYNQIQEGKLTVLHDNKPITEPKQRKETAVYVVNQALEQLRRLLLL